MFDYYCMQLMTATCLSSPCSTCPQHLIPSTMFASERTTCCPRQLFVTLEFSSTAMSLCGPMCRVRCPDILLCYDSSAASDAQCPILCSIHWSCRWLCHVSTTATQHSRDFLCLSSVDFSRFSVPPPD